MRNIAKWALATVLVVGSSIGYGEVVAPQEQDVMPASVAVTYSCWFEPKEDGTYEGLCGPQEDRTAGALDSMQLELPEQVDPAMVDRWKSLGAYVDPEAHCECLIVPVAAGFGDA